MRRMLALLLAAVLAISIAGCSTSGGTDGNQVVRINIGTEPETLDPGVSTGVPESNVQSALWEGLMRLDKDGRPVPGLAAKMPKVSEDGLTYTFTLRDAKWSNGDPVTAEDFVWAWKRNLDPRTASEYAYQLYYVKGGLALNTANADSASAIEAAMNSLGVKALDEKTLQVTLEAPAPYFLSLTAFHTLFPLHRKSVEADPEGWFRNPATLVGTGPFKLESWTSKDKVVVVKNPNYYDTKKIKLDRIEYFLIEEESTATTMFESGELDVVESGVNSAELDRLRVDQKDALHIMLDLGTYYYRFNVTKKPFNDPRVRKALTLAIDRQSIVDNITKGGQVPAYAFVPTSIPDVKGDFRENGGTYLKDSDIATAKKLLADAGYPDGKGFPKQTILYNSSEAHKRIAEAIQEMWKKNLGIEVDLTNAEWGVYLDMQSKLDFDISRAGWIGDYIDPMTFIDMFVTDGGNNQTGWSNAEYDALVAKAKATDDQKVRMKAMHDAEAILMDQLPIMPIYHYTRPTLVNPNLKGWSMPLTSPFQLRDAYWSK